MASRNFDREIEQETVHREDPVFFRLFGQQWDCRDDVNGKLLLDRMAEVDSDSLEMQRDGVVGILQMTVIDDQIDALLDALDDPNRTIQLAKLVEIAGWLVETYTERPTKPQPASTPGRAAAGRTSTAKRGGRASTSRRSTAATS